VVIFPSLLLILVAIVLAILGVVRGSDPLLIGSILASLLTAVMLATSARQAAAARLAAGREGLLVPFTPARHTGAGGDGEPDEGTDAGTVYHTPPATAEVRGDGGDAAVPGDASLAEAAGEPATVSIPSQAGPTYRDEERLEPAAPGESPTLVELDLRPGDLGTGDRPAEDLPREDLSTEDLSPGEDPVDEPPAQLVPPADAAVVARLDAPVVVVDGRPRYHLPTCVHLRDWEVESLPVSEAVELGFTPCSLCEPDTSLLAQARPT
jgi:hypothetical protein